MTSAMVMLEGFLHTALLRAWTVAHLLTHAQKVARKMGNFSVARRVLERPDALLPRGAASVAHGLHALMTGGRVRDFAPALAVQLTALRDVVVA
jgi:hypothetical protein